MKNSLDDDFLFCENIIKQNSHSFHTAFSLLEKKEAQAVYAVYAFCRKADDIVDKNEGGYSLKKFEDELKSFEKGEYIDSPLWRALRSVFERYELSIQPFYDMLSGQRMDQNFCVFTTQKQLENYCYLVAGTVGMMLAPIIAVKNHKIIAPFAAELGKAMQITNILRDIGEDFAMKRVYLPIKVMKMFRYSMDDLSKSTINRNFKNLWEYEAKIAKNYYDRFLSAVEYLDEKSIKPVLASALLYQKILDKVRENGYDCFGSRNYVTQDEKKIIISSIFLREERRV